MATAPIHNAPISVHLGGEVWGGAPARFLQHLLDTDNTPTRPALLGFGRDASEKIIDQLRAARVLKYQPEIRNGIVSQRWRIADAAWEERNA